MERKKRHIVLPPLPPGVTAEDIGRALVRPIRPVIHRRDQQREVLDIPDQAAEEKTEG